MMVNVIEEQGIVLETTGDAALVKARRTATCESCLSKDACKSLTETEMVIEAANPVGAKTGDEVVFTVGASTIIRAGVLLYLFPLLAFIAGVALGQAAARFIPALSGDLLSALLGFAFVGLTYLCIRIYGSRAERGAERPKIIRVIHKVN